MKKIKVILSMAVALFLVGTVSANAQGKYGADSAKCVNYLNFYRESLKQFKATKAAGNLKDAAFQAILKMLLSSGEVLLQLVLQKQARTCL